MKRSVLYGGIGYALFGLVCGVSAFFLGDTKFSGILWGMTGAGLGPGIAICWKYVYWSQPTKRAQYAAQVKNERIALHDERRAMLRDKSGRLTYLVMLGLFCALIFLCAICASLDVWMPFAFYAVILFSVLLVFQWLCGLILFRWLDRRL